MDRVTLDAALDDPMTVARDDHRSEALELPGVVLFPPVLAHVVDGPETEVGLVSLLGLRTADWSMLDTSTVWAKTSPFEDSSRTVRAVSSASTSHRATRAPDDRKRSAIARPNPCAAPVTAARRPVRSY